MHGWHGQWLCFAGNRYVNEDPRSGCNPVVFRLNCCGAPGLEQKHVNRSRRRSCLHDCVRRRRRLGAESVRSMAIKNAVRSRKQATPASQNAFAGRTKKPSETELRSVLGPCHLLWTQLVSDLKRDFDLDGADWHSSGVKYGWSYRVQRKGRNIVYLGPRAGMFVAAFVFGDKAVAVIRKSDLPDYVLKMLADAKRYSEGTPLRIDVTKPEDLEVVKVLARIKLEN